MVAHALSRDTEAFERPCIYVQLDCEPVESESEDEPPTTETYFEVSEFRISPADVESLESLYGAISECATLNPDTDMDDEEGDFYYDEEEVEAGVDPETREAMYGLYDSLLNSAEDLDELVGGNPERFEDACEDDAGSEEGNGHAQ
eukprot:CAMPEP_0177618470 /NCGR_PEP_ID=MMETSP0419_2-20121207/25598_1 /TAXON_ID=582737 /ORGANISM="Tetraselmis sp., Strain GSL018" /LENGTH=145 /DNA_ID=CAMNT_0019117381 /DNA_START=280 /DNA_END=717 /DNA_ORIENTATION=+